ncbi:MAG TPA: copper chaperone PCu(A)C [Nevskia sp.]|nr:copper chaperone PCu(A)C [Nevskia sp.]
MKCLVLAGALLGCCVTLPVLADCKGLKVEDAWIPQAPPVAPVLAGYARLVNGGGKPIHIDAVEGADFGSVELHQMSMENGMMQMRPLHGLDVPAHGGVTLADGGKHLMLMNPRHPFKAGDSATLVFRCGKRTTLVPFAVREAAP